MQTTNTGHENPVSKTETENKTTQEEKNSSAILDITPEAETPDPADDFPVITDEPKEKDAGKEQNSAEAEAGTEDKPESTAENACEDVSRETNDASEPSPKEPPMENCGIQSSSEDETEREAETETENTVSETSADEPEEEAPAEDSPASESESPQDYKKLGLYLHIPFCKSKCAYCDFYSTDKFQAYGHHIPKEMKQYCKALKNHMRITSEKTTQYNIDTIFVGGGTPTALPAKLLTDLVKEVSRDFYLDDHPEFTIEMNPATADLHLLKKLRKAGVNRLSIGLQSAHNHELAALSRIHTVGDFTECFQMAREAGFENINIDIMYGIPEQTTASFMETLEFVCNMKPEHISMYNLIFEPGTPFAEKEHMLPLPDEDSECDMYFGGIQYLADHGYHQYEMSNFAKEGYECRHNLKYWKGEQYIGCGSSAHSYFNNRRFSIKRSFQEYCAEILTAEHNIPASLRDENREINKKEELCEYLMLRLRLTEGISTEDFKACFGADFDELFGKRLQFYIDLDLMKHENGRYFFTPQGMFKSNYILSRIIPFDTDLSKIDPSYTQT